jgi:ribosome-associated translation inhibitor RaiA
MIKEDKIQDKKIHITFHQLDHSKALGQRISNKAQKLLKFHPYVSYCRIVVNQPHHHKHKGNLYNIHLEIKVPGQELVINKQPGVKTHPHQDPYVAVDDAFKAAERSLNRYKEKMEGIIKHHQPPLHGTISKLENNYGYIESPNHSEIYFHENTLDSKMKFSDLTVGSTVHFALVNESTEDLKASYVKLVGGHSILDDVSSIKEITFEEV